MESVEGIFTNLSETVKVNFIPIAIVLALVLLIVGYLIYRSISVSPKIEEENFEPDVEQANENTNQEDYGKEEGIEQPEYQVQDENTSPE